MCDEFTEADLDRAGLPVRRRDFGALMGVGAVAAMLPAAACAAGTIKGRDVTITTDDGTVDAYFVAPGEGKHPGVLMWPDIRGLRPAFRQMADRLAGAGYAVLCVNPFYRWAKAPVVYAGHDFDDPGVRETLFGYLKQLNRTLVQTDAKAHLVFLDAQAEVDTAKGRHRGLLHGRADGHLCCGAEPGARQGGGELSRCVGRDRQARQPASVDPRERRRISFRDRR